MFPDESTKRKPSPRRLIFSVFLCTVWAACSPLMLALHLPVVSEQECAVKGCFPHNKVPLVEDVPADRTKEIDNSSS